MLKRVLALAATAIFIAVVGVVVYGWSNGVRFYGVESGSMSPALGTGDLVIDAPTTTSTKYQVGDIITFHPNPGYTTTHRIVSIDAAGITTKGDANPSSDVGQIPPASVVGRVIAVVPYGGSVAAFFRQPAGMAAVLVGMISLYIAWGLVSNRKPDPSSDPVVMPSPESPTRSAREPE